MNRFLDHTDVQISFPHPVATAFGPGGPSNQLARLLSRHKRGLNCLKLFLLIGWTTLLSSGCTSIHKLDASRHQVIPLSAMIQDPSRWEAVGQQINEGKMVIFKVGPGERVPLKLVTEVPVGRIEPIETQLTFNRDTYLLISKTELEVSPDGQQWTSLGDLKALKKLFGFQHGSVSVGFHATKEQGTFFAVDLRVK